VSDGGPGAAAEGECRRCGGTGFVHAEVGAREFAQRCRCRLGARATAARDRDPLETLGIPGRYRNCTLGNFEPRTPALSAAYDRALAYSHRFEAARAEGLGLLFWGPTGTGKTHLAAAILTELAANQRVRGRFWHFAALLDEIARSYDKTSMTSESERLAAVLEADLLVLDDLGSRKMTDWASDTLFTIVNGRYMARRPTVITTSYEDVSREVAMEADARRRQEYLIERLGQRLRSRLLEMCAFVPMQTVPERDGQRRPSRPSTLGGMRRAQKGSL
jgi:DNA replication protein DnaC